MNVDEVRSQVEQVLSRIEDEQLRREFEETERFLKDQERSLRLKLSQDKTQVDISMDCPYAECGFVMKKTCDDHDPYGADSVLVWTEAKKELCLSIAQHLVSAHYDKAHREIRRRRYYYYEELEADAQPKPPVVF